jgi:hypothetical protein
MPNIVVINEATVVADADVQVMLPAFDLQWNRDLKAIWGVDGASFNFLSKGQSPAAGSWWVVLLDDSDQAGALAYHDLTNDGLPLSKVFARSLLDEEASISVAASHEICEMAVDPWLNSAYQDATGVFWACEVCDPVEDDQYGYKIGDVLVTDFVTPNWFGHLHARSPMDRQNHADSPFLILSGGYAQHFQAGKGWVQVTGARAMCSARGRTATAGSRRERRTRQATEPLQPSFRRW